MNHQFGYDLLFLLYVLVGLATAVFFLVYLPAVLGCVIGLVRGVEFQGLRDIYRYAYFTLPKEAWKRICRYAGKKTFRDMDNRKT